MGEARDVTLDRWPRHLHLVHLVLPTSISCVDLDRSIVAARQPRSQPHDAKVDSGGHTSPASRIGRSQPRPRTRSTQEMDGGENKVDEMKVARPPVFVNVHLRKVYEERRRL